MFLTYLQKRPAAGGPLAMARKSEAVLKSTPFGHAPNGELQSMDQHIHATLVDQFELGC